MTIAAYMAMALHDPDRGYYARRDPLGARGDFVTAPEISQIFGELIGLWCADLWRRLGSPDPVILAELGPGRGTLMADFLRASRGVGGFREALRLYLVEASPLLRETQQQALQDIAPVWIASFDELPDGPLRQGGEEFVGDEQQRSHRQRIDARDKIRASAAEAAVLPGAQHRARLDKIQIERPAEVGQDCRRTQKVAEERTAAGA